MPLDFPPEHEDRLSVTIELLNLHKRAFYAVLPYADATKHPVPTDTRAWSQIIASTVSGIPGIERKKGPDLADGSDVKAANVWEAIDTPRFNGCIKAGRKTSASSGDLASLDEMPHLFFVMWDNQPESERHRCRLWVVRTTCDPVFRSMCEDWYEKRRLGEIKSDNFQLHPPRNLNSNQFRNTCGNLSYPLLLEAMWDHEAASYEITDYVPKALAEGVCRPEDYRSQG